MYDVAIIGGGAAAHGAALYAMRYRLATVMVLEEFGGETATASVVENYPGHVSIDGLELMKTMETQVKKLGAEVILGKAERVERDRRCFMIGVGGSELEAKSVILAVGRERRTLGLPHEKEWLGLGISYCPTCDAPLYADQIVGIVGGGDSAVKGAILLAKYAKRVYVIHRGAKLRGEPINNERLQKASNVSILFNTRVTALQGEGGLRAVVLDPPYQGEEELPLDGLFVEIGAEPRVELAKSLGGALDESGYIQVDSMMRTNVPGFFAAGDVTNASGSLKQVITSAAQGVLAATAAYKHVSEGGDFCDRHAHPFKL